MDHLSLETILKEFGVVDEQELFKKRTTEKQIKPSEIVEAPRLVPMTAEQCKRLCEKAKMQYHPGYEGRVIERVTTTELPDRYGDIVRYKGADIADYKKNAVVLHAHEHGNPPVGKSLKLWSDPAIKGWRSWDLHFGEELDPTGYYEYIFRLVASGAMPGGSIGFLPTDDGVKADHTPEERETLGLGKYGLEFLAWKYLEHSVCSVPANPEALANNLKAIGVPRLVKFFSQVDLDGMERLKILNGNMLDVFAVTLGIKKQTVEVNVNISKIPKEYKDEDEFLKDTEEYEMRPYPNEHACRLVDPDKFDKMRRGKRKHEGKEYSVIFGHYKDKDSWGEQAYRYSKDTWTSSEAKSHCKSHDGISFEPASDGKSIEDECTTCGTQKQVVVNVTVTGLEKLLDEIESLKKQVAELSYREATPSADQRREGGKKLHELIFDINKKQ